MKRGVPYYSGVVLSPGGTVTITFKNVIELVSIQPIFFSNSAGTVRILFDQPAISDFSADLTINEIRVGYYTTSNNIELLNYPVFCKQISFINTFPGTPIYNLRWFDL